MDARLQRSNEHVNLHMCCKVFSQGNSYYDCTRYHCEQRMNSKPRSRVLTTLSNMFDFLYSLTLTCFHWLTLWSREVFVKDQPSAHSRTAAPELWEHLRTQSLRRSSLVLNNSLLNPEKYLSSATAMSKTFCRPACFQQPPLFSCPFFYFFFFLIKHQHIHMFWHHKGWWFRLTWITECIRQALSLTHSTDLKLLWLK